MTRTHEQDKGCEASQMAEEYADDRCGNWEECERDNEWEEAKRGFLAGYQAAKDEYKVAIDTYNDVAKQMLEEAVRIMSPKDQLADAAKVMPEWISVKDRLPETNKLCIVNTEWRGVVPATYGNESWIFDEGQGWSEKPLSYALHWIPLPEAPKDE